MILIFKKYNLYTIQNTIINRKNNNNDYGKNYFNNNDKGIKNNNSQKKNMQNNNKIN